LLAIFLAASAWTFVDRPSRDEPRTSSVPVPVVASSTTTTLPSLNVTRVSYEAGLEADVYRPLGSGPRGAVLLVHGRRCVLSAGDLESAGEAIAGAGMVAVSIEHTSCADDDVSSNDLRDALSWLRGLDGVDAERIALLVAWLRARLVA
jgi:hypothetical protein